MTEIFPISWGGLDKGGTGQRVLRYTSKLMFSGDSLAAVYDRNYYNFRLDERTKESEDSYIRGKI